MSQARRKRRWLRWRRYEMRCEKLAGFKDPLWWGAVHACSKARSLLGSIPRWMR